MNLSLMNQSPTPGATVAGPLLVFVLQVAVLYFCGSYATGRALSFASGSASGRAAGRGILGRAMFYTFVLPGVVLHESAHYAACIVTGTRVARFAPFAPRKDGSGRLILGYVSHERRPAPLMALIGLAPMVINPVGILAVTALMTPLSPTGILGPARDSLESLVNTGFATDQPLIATAWAYLVFSFAVGSVPSREDLSSLPAALVIFATGAAAFVFLGGGGSLLAGAAGLAAHANGLYALPALVALMAAAFCLIAGLLRPSAAHP